MLILREMDLNHRPLAYEANELSAALSRSGCSEAWTHDLSVKSRLLYQLSYTPIVQQQHDRLRSRRYRLTIFWSFKKGIPFLLFLKCNKIVFLCNHNSLVQMLLSINYHRSNFLKDLSNFMLWYLNFVIERVLILERWPLNSDLWAFIHQTCLHAEVEEN